MDNKNIILQNVQVRALTPEQIENRQAEFVISTEAVDSYGTVFRLDGWDLTRYEQNPIVLYAHRSGSDDPDNIIGSGEVFREGDALIGRVTFEAEEVNPKAEKIFRKVQAGTLRMASVGARVEEGHFGERAANEDPDVLYFTRQQLYEFSVVPVGANPDALKRSAEAVEEIKEQYTRNIEVNEPENVPAEKETLSIREAQYLINKNQ